MSDNEMKYTDSKMLDWLADPTGNNWVAFRDDIQGFHAGQYSYGGPASLRTKPFVNARLAIIAAMDSEWDESWNKEMRKRWENKRLLSTEQVSGR